MKICVDARRTKSDGKFHMVKPRDPSPMRNEAVDMKPVSSRIQSIDALRGFAMIWIAGAAEVVTNLNKIFAARWTKFLNQQLQHAEWVGCNFYDLILPLFLFLTGCAMVFSFDKRLVRDGKIKTCRHILVRVFCLWMLGMIAAGVLDGWEGYRLLFFSDVLQGIAISYLAASLILFIKSLRWQIMVSIGLLVTYFCLMHFVPVPGHGAGAFTFNGNLAAYIDAKVAFFHDYGYTCILSIMTWTVTVMIGCFAGRYLKRAGASGVLKSIRIFLAGVCLIAIGLILTPYDPCIKRIWTVSYTLVSGGACLILLACFFYAVDVKRLNRIAFPLTIVGANSLFVYVVFSYGRIIDPGDLVGRGLSWLQPVTSPYYPLITSTLGFLLMLMALCIMYRRRIFIRV